ncbi:hypothetical protein HX017_15665 [Myroides marinus]|nr:hypothetical protein [Myroides marinus]MDM1348328.1 hypothetical protein [Myroides marinus]MDM1351841.1 hypothetical protein [Myroides marinus]MDM1355430.1 hypothetical protein [Myroides marinus]MDM1359047.1 hypothetical protein [Myroides marinus]MDM1366379.1 hypothetical protein [Myroides marinus]
MYHTTKYLGALMFVLISTLTLAKNSSRPYLDKEQKSITGKWKVETVVYDKDGNILKQRPSAYNSSKMNQDYTVFHKNGSYEKVYFMGEKPRKKDKSLVIGNWELCEEVSDYDSANDTISMDMQLMMTVLINNSTDKWQITSITSDTIMGEMNIEPKSGEIEGAHKAILRMTRIK